MTSTAPERPTSTRPVASVLLDGCAGQDGFVFHDGHNQATHKAAPGLLGLLESRCVIERWKPQT